jgi:hypothetical protein
LDPDVFKIHEREAILEVQTGNTGKFFDKTLRADLPFMPPKEEPRFIGDPNVAWPNMHQFFHDREEIMTWIQGGP